MWSVIELWANASHFWWFLEKWDTFRRLPTLKDSVSIDPSTLIVWGKKNKNRSQRTLRERKVGKQDLWVVEEWKWAPHSSIAVFIKWSHVVQNVSLNPGGAFWESSLWQWSAFLCIDHDKKKKNSVRVSKGLGMCLNCTSRQLRC